MNWISPVILQVLRKVNDGSSTKMLRRTITEYKKKNEEVYRISGNAISHTVWRCRGEMNLKMMRRPVELYGGLKRGLPHLVGRSAQ